MFHTMVTTPWFHTMICLFFQTEDQILLLQNSWAELVSLGAIWRSRFSHGIIQLSFGKTIDIKKAREMKHEEVSETSDG